MSAQHDLSKKLQISLGEVLTRETAIAAHLLGPADIALMLIEAAVMMMRTASATTGGYANGEADARNLFNMTMDSIIEQVNRSREEAIAKMLAGMAGRARSA